MGTINDQLAQNAMGLRLCRMFGDELRLYELVTFKRGRTGVEIILRRAAIAGRVEIEGENGDFFADVFTDADSWSQCVALDGGSFKYLKDKLRPRVAQ